MGCRPVCTEDVYGLLYDLLQTGTRREWCHYILDTSVNKIDYKTVIYKVFKQIEMEMSSLLGRLRPKGLPFTGFKYFYLFFSQVQVYDGVGSAVGFYLLKYMKGQGNVLFWSVKRRKGY